MDKYKYYQRKINYYETDKMGVVHHSNYARYLEECRVDMLEHYGMPLNMFEENGYVIPVLELHSKFHESIKFGDMIKIVPKVEKVSLVKFCVSYIIYDEQMEIIKHTAESVHCLLDKDFKPVGLKKTDFGFYEKLKALAQI